MGIPKKKVVTVSHADVVKDFSELFGAAIAAAASGISRALQDSKAPIQAFQGESQTSGLRAKRKEFTASVVAGMHGPKAKPMQPEQLWLLAMLAPGQSKGMHPARVVTATMDAKAPITRGHVKEIAALVASRITVVKDDDARSQLTCLYIGAKSLVFAGALRFSGATWPAYMPSQGVTGDMEEALALYMKAVEYLETKSGALTESEADAWTEVQNLELTLPTVEALTEASIEHDKYVEARQEHFKCDAASIQAGIDSIDPLDAKHIRESLMRATGYRDAEIADAHLLVNAETMSVDATHTTDGAECAKETPMSVNTANTTADNINTNEASMPWYKKILIAVAGAYVEGANFRSVTIIDTADIPSPTKGTKDEESTLDAIKRIGGEVVDVVKDFFWSIGHAIKGIFVSEEAGAECDLARRNKRKAKALAFELAESAVIGCVIMGVAAVLGMGVSVAAFTTTTLVVALAFFGQQAHNIDKVMRFEQRQAMDNDAASF